MSADEDLVAGFEACSLPEFHHADHVRLTIVYLERHGRAEALRRLEEGLLRLATSDGQPERFHVTLTRAWLELINAARTAHPDAAGASGLVDACPWLLDRDVLLRFYSRECLNSETARKRWVPPDRGEISSL